MATSLVFGLSVRPTHAQSVTSNTGVVIPLYNYPDSTWTTIEQAAASHPNVPIIAVINPNSGPGSSADPTFAQGIKNLQAAGVTVLGYVDTLSTSIASAESQVNQYYNWYAVNGIMFDDMFNTPGEGNSYFSTLNAYVKTLPGLDYTMGNPGTSVSTSAIGIFNTLCIYESASYPSLSFISYPGYPNSDFAYIAYGVTYDSAFVLASAPYVGYMYIDNLSGGNPYYTLSSLFAQTVSTLSTVDTLGSTTSTTSTSTTTTSTTTTTSSASSTTSSTTSRTSTSSTTTSTKTTSSTSSVSIKVRSASLAGAVFTGMWTTISSGSGALLATGYTTFTYAATSGSTYLVCVANYGTTIFQHWQDGSTNPCKKVTPKSNVALTAFYSLSTTSQLTITSQTTSGSTLTGFWTELYDQTGTVLATGYTPIAYTLNDGQSYTVEADSYGSCNFTYWQDNGDTNFLRAISINSDTNLVAVYTC